MFASPGSIYSGRSDRGGSEVAQNSTWLLADLLTSLVSCVHQEVSSTVDLTDFIITLNHGVGESEVVRDWLNELQGQLQASYSKNISE
eukprot:4723895-Amphidinium_carterae.1